MWSLVRFLLLPGLHPFQSFQPFHGLSRQGSFCNPLGGILSSMGIMFHLPQSGGTPRRNHARQISSFRNSPFSITKGEFLMPRRCYWASEGWGTLPLGILYFGNNGNSLCLLPCFQISVPGRSFYLCSSAWLKTYFELTQHMPGFLHPPTAKKKISAPECFLSPGCL